MKQNITYAGRHPAITQLDKDIVGMTRAVQKGINKPINIVIYGVKAFIFEQYQQELQNIGYHLTVIPKISNTMQDVRGSDICIVDIAELEPSQALFQNTNLPFLVYGIDRLPSNAKVLDISYGAGGGVFCR